MDLSNFASNKKILNGVILFKVTLGVTLTQPIYIYIYVCVCVCVLCKCVAVLDWERGSHKSRLENTIKCSIFFVRESMVYLGFGSCENTIMLLL